jgi:hypothetical protein
MYGFWTLFNYISSKKDPCIKKAFGSVVKIASVVETAECTRKYLGWKLPIFYLKYRHTENISSLSCILFLFQNCSELHLPIFLSTFLTWTACRWYKQKWDPPHHLQVINTVKFEYFFFFFFRVIYLYSIFVHE